MLNNKHILLHLSLIDGISSAAIAQILAQQEFDLAHLYTMSVVDIAHRFQLSSAKAAAIKAGLADTKILDTELELIDKHAIVWATVTCTEYPHILKTIHMMPPVIYWRGDMLHNDEKSIAFVGSRGANTYGQYAIDQLVPPLVERGYVIVSGGAKGADAMAHKAAIEHGGKTIAVLGAGLLMPYLASNRQLFEAIAAGHGAVMSGFPLRMEAYPTNFPARNRIISGLSRGTVVVQAAAKSGALITARFALDQGRDVFAIPGPIHDPLSAGCHGLIAQGGTLVASVEDILREFGEYIPDSQAKEKPQKNKEAKQMLISEASAEDKIECESKGIVDTSPSGIVIRACVQACSMDDLVEKTGLDATQLQGMLFDLQLEGRVKQNFMGMWERVR